MLVYGYGLVIHVSNDKGSGSCACIVGIAIHILMLGYADQAILPL